METGQCDVTAGSEDGGRVQNPRKAGGLWKLGKARKWDSPLKSLEVT